MRHLELPEIKAEVVVVALLTFPGEEIGANRNKGNKSRRQRSQIGRKQIGRKQK